MVDEAVRDFYELGMEAERLASGTGALELARSQELLLRHLPPPPADVLDVGGGPGVYSSWLALLGYRVRLIDPVPLHVAQAMLVGRSQPDHPFDAIIGDALRLEEPEGQWDAVLLMGPLYHLTERADRLQALGEARRVVRPGGAVFVAAISRFASLLDGLSRGFLFDPAFRSIVERDLREGQHRNPDSRPHWFTTAYFHHPDELREEAVDADLDVDEVLGVEGPAGWIGPLFDHWDDPAHGEAILFASRAVESEPSVVGASAHLILVARRL